MRIAIPIWDGRVSPVFDVSRSIRVIDITNGIVTRQADHKLDNASRTSTLAKLGVDYLICAAISAPLEAMLWVSGVEVVSDTCGAIEDIVSAFVSGDTRLRRYRSPGYVRSGRSSAKVLRR